MFQFKGRGDKEFGLGWTHEEIVTPLVQKFVNSYKDLPVAVYQIQDKFRNEPRAKSGILRGREFSMKDLYSFHANEEDLLDYYEKSKQAYLNIFERCGLDALIVEASGGAFSKYSHEFQVLTESGEDIIFHCGECGYAQNKEISEYKSGDNCPNCKGTMNEGKAIEVGNIFKLKTRFTEAFKFNFTDEDGKQKPVLMGCYGIGPSRVMGSVVEVHHDDNGMLWPKTIAPYHVHVVMLGSKDESTSQRIEQVATSLHDDLEKIGVEVLCDDRPESSAGEKFADADLIGVPLRIVVSEKTLAEDSVEWKERTSDEQHLTKLDSIIEEVKTWLQN